jgi:hypothetical protein
MGQPPSSPSPSSSNTEREKLDDGDDDCGGCKATPLLFVVVLFLSKHAVVTHRSLLFGLQEISIGQVGVGLFSTTGQEISVPQTRCTYLSYRELGTLAV